jgi:hypothetical protein
MGGSTRSTSTSTSTTNPWEPTIGPLNDIVTSLGGMTGSTGLNPTETGALDTLTTNATAGNPFAGSINSLATDLLNGGVNRTAGAQSAYDDLSRRLTPIANGDFVNPESNPALRGYLDTISNDIQNRVNGMFAGAGRDMSGANQGQLARGLSEGLAPTMLNAYNTERDRQLGAIDALYTGSNATTGLLSGLDQQSLANRQAGVDVSSTALQANDSSAQRLLEIEAQRRGIPLQNLSGITGLLGPIAQLGSQSDSTTTTTQRTPLGQQIMGGIMGGLGLGGQLGGFGQNGWLYGRNGGGLLNGLFGGR